MANTEQRKKPTTSTTKRILLLLLIISAPIGFIFLFQILQRDNSLAVPVVVDTS